MKWINPYSSKLNLWLGYSKTSYLKKRLQPNGRTAVKYSKQTTQMTALYFLWKNTNLRKRTDSPWGKMPWRLPRALESGLGNTRNERRAGREHFIWYLEKMTETRAEQYLQNHFNKRFDVPCCAYWGFPFPVVCSIGLCACKWSAEATIPSDIPMEQSRLTNCMW